MDIPGLGGKSNDSFIDRSKVRILLCDGNLKNSQEAFTLLSKCSYQVTCVKSARQVIDALNAEGGDIDIILSEVDLPVAKGMKMLKYITRDNNLRRIPVIMMSAQDEVSIVVKCLRLGAADYLVKPLRTNELLNLWTHVWRRRRMLGLAEKNIMNYEFELVASDPSDAKTNSTTLFSDDTTNPETGIPAHQEDEVNTIKDMPNSLVATAMMLDASLEPPPVPLWYHPEVPGNNDCWTGQTASCPKKSELRIGESSAFFSYVKSSIPRTNIQEIAHVLENTNPDTSTQEKLKTWTKQPSNNAQGPENQFIPDKSSTPPVMMDFPRELISKTKAYSQQPEVLNSHLQSTYPYYIPPSMNHVMMSQYPQAPNMSSFQFYPMGSCLNPSQVSPHHPHHWPSYGLSTPATNTKLSKADRRKAALMKFRQKRKERCYDKKIRYVNRKTLAERRPRVRGQFVRKMNGLGFDLNGTPGSVDLDEEDDGEENIGIDSSPEDET